MATIIEDYVSGETFKLLKEKGFDDSYCRFVIESDKTYYRGMPTLQMAMKWLREVHGLHISLEPCYDYDSMHVEFLAFVQNVADVHEFMDGRKNVATHPSAETSYELSIKYCLENLI